MNEIDDFWGDEDITYFDDESQETKQEMERFKKSCSLEEAKARLKESMLRLRQNQWTETGVPLIPEITQKLVDSKDTFLSKNPNDNIFEWLLKQRCQNDQQRASFKKLIETEKSLKGGLTTTIFEVQPRQKGLPLLSDIDSGKKRCAVKIFFDFKLNGIYYDFDTPEIIDAIYKKEGANAAGIAYLTWKVSTLGNIDGTDISFLDSSNMVYQMYNQLSQYKDGYRPWISFLG